MSKDSRDKDGLSRRQFLTYALGGTGAFMAAAVTAPMIPFAVDPLTRGSQVTPVPVGKVDDFKVGEPKKVEFTVHKKDGWVETDAKMSAWVIRQEDNSFLAMSPICTHLGCQVNPVSEGDVAFHCPCHDSKFTKNGVPKKGVPATRPLDKYEARVENGQLLLGAISKRKSEQA